MISESFFKYSNLLEICRFREGVVESLECNILFICLSGGAVNKQPNSFSVILLRYSYPIVIAISASAICHLG